MISGAVTGRVYAALKEEVLSGALLPGSRLDPSRLAEGLASSATPARDALYQLAGERLVETRPSEGFFVPHLREADLRDRYEWAEAILKLALGAWSRSENTGPARTDVDGGYGFALRSIFDAIGAGSVNSEHALHIAASSDRLHAVRRAEEAALGGAHEEVRSMAAALEVSDRVGLGRLIGAFHRRRIRAASAILAAVYRG